LTSLDAEIARCIARLAEREFEGPVSRLFDAAASNPKMGARLLRRGRCGERLDPARRSKAPAAA